MPNKGPIYVTRPHLAPFEEVRPIFEGIWERRVLTNAGPVLQRFEADLETYFGLPHLSLVANATLGLVAALHHLDVRGEVITTPFSFAATAHAIRLVGAEPVFADIDPVTLNIDPAEVEARITPKTSAILAVHCFGTPCDTAALAEIARRHGLALIYDAAHAFGATDGGGSILRHGDLSVVSFHATKVFHSCEGGAVIAPDRETKLAIDAVCNHGITEADEVEMVGLNAKMSELHAAVGIAELAHAGTVLAARHEIATRYADGLADVPGIGIVCPPDRPGANYYAFPIMVAPDYPLSRDALWEALAQDGIFARRYFHPVIADMAPYRDIPSAAPGGLAIARKAADDILCLPVQHDLDTEAQQQIIERIAGVHSESQSRWG